MVIITKNKKSLNEAKLTLNDLAYDRDFEHFRKAEIRSPSLPQEGYVDIGLPLKRSIPKGQYGTSPDIPGSLIYSDSANKVIIIITRDMEIMSMGGGGVLCSNGRMEIGLFK